MILQITNNEALGTQVTQNKRNEAVAASIGDSGTDGGIDGSIENLSTVANLAKSKKAKSTKFKKSDLLNVKANFETDFLIPEAKEAYIHLQKAFTKGPIFRHFDLERHI